MSLYIGLMSGTSMDGIDGVLVEFPDEKDGCFPPNLLLNVRADAHITMPPTLGTELLALNTPGDNELHRGAIAANALAHMQAQLVVRLLDQANVSATAVRAVGSHGQTVRHRPGEFDRIGYTLQLNNGALLAELCGIAVVCDFRSRDLAAGGQGAPLVPPFHATIFGNSVLQRAVLNIGGIANLTLLPTPHSPLRGFDCGPGNTLMDYWCQAHTGHDFDDQGHWAASGQVHTALLERLLADAYFAKPAPKSTGRDLFNSHWLEQALTGLALEPADVQATLLETSARAAIDALRREAPATRELLVCGGGALNTALMHRLGILWPALDVRLTTSAGLPPLQVEASAFAWLARQFCERRPGNCPAATGAQGARVLGAYYPV